MKSTLPANLASSVLAGALLAGSGLALFSQPALAEVKTYGPELQRFSLDVPASWKEEPQDAGIRLVSPDGRAVVAAAVAPSEGKSAEALVPGRGRLGLESDAETAGFLEGAGIPYRRVPLELEFGQPLDSFEEALAFAAHYGRDASPGEAERWLEARLVRLGDGSYYLPHAKKLALYAFPA